MSLEDAENFNLYDEEYTGSLCRLCADKSDSPLISIFCGGSNNFATKLMFYLPIKVAETDNMPLEICMTCLDSILRWDDFYQNFVDADRKLRNCCGVGVKEKPQNLDHAENTMYDNYDSYEQEEYYTEQNIKTANSTNSFLHNSEPRQGYRTRNSMKRHDDENLLKVMKMVDEQDEISDQAESVLIEGSDEYYSSNDLLEPIGIRKPMKINTTCKECHITFATDVKVAIHMLEVHNKHHFLQTLLRLQLNKIDELEMSRESKVGKQSYRCKYCGRIFASPSKLSVHLRTHTGDRPFHCFLCNKTFRQTCHAITHMKLTHFNIRRFECKVCHRMFQSRSKFRFHLTKHREGGKF